ncbi:putative pheromone receptor [Mycena pura]|uniref:Pheromone receptor n=1 Tax=Mycena pura TaxID=153505 RepID=A0AAD6ULM2_9AGAR|nr:putative pheromone receptor [Mycena pura]
MYYYNGAPNAVFSTFSFLGLVLSLIPLRWHLEAWNVGTCMFMIWTALGNLIFFINSIVWSGNVIDWSPTYCDISTHLLVGLNVAIPAASLCINRRLYHIAAVRAVSKTRAERRRAICIDLAITVGLPVLQIPIQYIVQGHRYDIVEDLGCFPETYETWVAVLLYHLPPTIIGSISAVYCICSIRSFYRSRAQFKAFLSSSNNLTVNRYIRLMCLAATDLLCTVPISIWIIVTEASVYGLDPRVSWAVTHSNFSRVGQFPGIIWRSDKPTVMGLEMNRWLFVACAFIFFIFFGFADEARKNYRSAFTTVARRVGYTTAGKSSGTLSSNGYLTFARCCSATSKANTLPVFIRKETARKRDSIGSFSSDGLDSLSYIEKEKSFAGTDSYIGTKASFGALSLSDVGGLLPEYKSTLSSPVESESESSGASSVGEDDIEVSSLHRASIVPPPAAHTRAPHASHPDIPVPPNDIV